VEGGWIDPEFELSTRVAAQCAVVVEVAPTQWDMESSVPELRRKRQNAASEECLSVPGRLADNE
jgi:hypothetical protein